MYEGVGLVNTVVAGRDASSFVFGRVEAVLWWIARGWVQLFVVGVRIGGLAGARGTGWAGSAAEACIRVGRFA
jgi:hypothetical protein